MAAENPRSSVKTTKTVFEIVEALQELNGGRVTEVAEHIDMSKSTISKHLSTLYEEEYVIKRDGVYHLGLKFLDHGGYARSNRVLSDVASTGLKNLAEETGETVWLLVEEYGYAVYIDRATGKNAIRLRSRIGERAHMHYLAGGKAMLAHFPERKVAEIIDRRGLPSQTDHTITDPDELYDELETVQEQGVAFNKSEEIENVRAVGAPVKFEGEVLGAITVGGPANKMKGTRFTEEIPDLLLGVINEIELQLTFG
jgi:IclR family acetate operon transcriptional repressor